MPARRTRGMYSRDLSKKKNDTAKNLVIGPLREPLIKILATPRPNGPTLLTELEDRTPTARRGREPVPPRLPVVLGVELDRGRDAVLSHARDAVADAVSDLDLLEAPLPHQHVHQLLDVLRAQGLALREVARCHGRG